MIIPIQMYKHDFSEVCIGWVNPDHVVCGVPQEHSVPHPQGGKKLENAPHIRLLFSVITPGNTVTMDIVPSEMPKLVSISSKPDKPASLDQAR
jgi:hypothetical protein